MLTGTVRARNVCPDVSGHRELPASAPPLDTETGWLSPGPLGASGGTCSGKEPLGSRAAPARPARQTLLDQAFKKWRGGRGELVGSSTGATGSQVLVVSQVGLTVASWECPWDTGPQEAVCPSSLSHDSGCWGEPLALLQHPCRASCCAQREQQLLLCAELCQAAGTARPPQRLWPQVSITWDSRGPTECFHDHSLH